MAPNGAKVRTNHAEDAMFPSCRLFLVQRVFDRGVFVMSDRSCSAALLGSATGRKLAGAVGRASLDIPVLDLGAD